MLAVVPLLLALLSPVPVGGAPPAVETIGHSVRGQPIVVRRIGPPVAVRRILFVGCIHGDERAGIAVAHALIQRRAASSAALWVLSNLNPDGAQRGTRVNGRGVDLNRNFPIGWPGGGRPWNPVYPGPRPFSEPETRAVRSLVKRVRPTVTIWMHQQFESPIVRAWGRSIPAARRYARWTGMRFRRIPWSAGSAPHWQNTLPGGGSSFVVELQKGHRMSAAEVRLHVRAVARLGKMAR
jgi:predicted deacylase